MDLYVFLCPPEEGKAPTLEPNLGATPDGQRVVVESLMHVLSMGSKAMMLQVWADLSTGVFTFRWAAKEADVIHLTDWLADWLAG